MTEQYIRERRADSIQTMVPVTAIFVVVASLLSIVILSADLLRYWSLWLNIAASPLAARLTWRMLQQGRQRLPGRFFIAVHLVLITLTYADTWSPNSFVPFLFAVPIIISSMLIDLRASLYTWFASVVLTVAALFVAGEVTASAFVVVAAASGYNLVLALASFLSSMDWQMALQSVSEMQRRAQQRRDELFTMKEDLAQVNGRLHHTNLELDKARQAALHERDLRTRFMNNVSHELRTPLNAVVNFAHILAVGGRGGVTEDQADYLGRIEHAGEHVLQLLNDLLDLAQIESGEFKLYREAGSLEPICEGALSHTRGLVLDKEVNLVRDYPEVWPEVNVDPVRLKQALINLLGNAAKYTDNGHIALRVRPAGDVVHVHIEDTGVGIDPRYHEVIFQEFRQLDETAARKRMGTGLGLPITRHLIERHGGRLALKSEMGAGSTFTVTLPVWQGEEVEPVEATAVAAG